jgi:hypothetical protein
MPAAKALTLIKDTVSSGSALERNLANPKKGEYNNILLSKFAKPFTKGHILAHLMRWRRTNQVGRSTKQ